METALAPPPSAAEAQARGYDAAFLGPPVPPPQLTTAGRKNAVGGSTHTEVVRHTHYSLVVHAGRRLAVWVARNTDGGQMRRLSRSGVPFVPDPAVDLRYQTADPLYAGNRLDRGHLARRADLCWGPDAEARRSNRESFYFTNVTPQMENFNQSAQGGLWGRPEDAVFEPVTVENLRVSAFGGPVFRPDDRMYRGGQIPLDFYKCWLTGRAAAGPGLFAHANPHRPGGPRPGGVPRVPSHARRGGSPLRISVPRRAQGRRRLRGAPGGPSGQRRAPVPPGPG